MKRFLILCLTTLFALTTWAYDFEVDGFFYNIIEDEGNAVELANENGENQKTSYSDIDIVVPSTVDYEGTTYTVKGIGAYCFNSGNSGKGIQTVELPSTITYIGDYAFHNCYYLTTINIPDNVTTIGAYAYDGVEETTEISLGKSVETIKTHALFIVAMKATVYSYNPTPPTCENDVFDIYMEDYTLYVPAGCYDVYHNADPWGDFDKIREMDIVDPSITTNTPTDILQTTATFSATIIQGTYEIVERGFEYWPNGGSRITVPVTDFSGDEVTASISGLTSGQLYTCRAYAITDDGNTTYGNGETFTTMSYYSFYKDGFYYNIVNANQRTCEVSGLYPASAQNRDVYSGDIIIPSSVELDGIIYTVVGTGTYAFYYCDGITSVTMPDTFTSIGYASFGYCTGITNISIPSFLTSIGVYAFSNCTSLEEVTIPSSVQTINRAAFNECSSLTEVTIPNSVTDMSSYVFYGCTSLESVTLSNSINSIGDYTFHGCSSLKSIEMPNTVTTIGQSAFYNCTSLKTAPLSNTLTSIGSNAFYSTCIEELTLPTTLKTIDGYAFEHTNIRELDIPDNVTTIGYYAFAHCDSLKTVTIGSGVTDVALVFDSDKALEEVTFSKNNTMLALGQGSFEACSSLRKINIPKTVTSIELGALYACRSLEEITIPKLVESIGGNAFTWDTSLTKIYSLNPEPPICGMVSSTWGVFENVDTDACTLYVPVGSYEAYRTADQWEDFMNVVEMVGVETLDAGDVTASSAVLNGKITIGEYSMDVTKEGFEFWKDGLDNVITTIGIEESEMSYTITNLDPETTYTYRAFATTEDGTTYYGENVSFTTGEDTSTGIDNVGMGGINGENVEGIYSTSGQKLNSTVKGVNIIRYADGTVKKIYVK